MSSQKAADTLLSKQTTAYHAKIHILELEIKATGYILKVSCPSEQVALTHCITKFTVQSQG